MAELRDLWWVWLLLMLLGWAGDVVSARLVYWQRVHIVELKLALERARRASQKGNDA